MDAQVGGTRLVRDAMSRRVVTIDCDEPVSRAAECLAEEDVGVLAVCGRDRRLSGVITDRDIVIRTLAQRLDPERLTAGECGTGNPVTVSPSETLDEAARRMDEQQVRRLPVTQTGRLVGIVTHADLAANGADRQAGRLLARMARLGGDRRSARWLLKRSYRERKQSSGSPPSMYALAPFVETPPLVYLGGMVVGIFVAALALLQLGAA
jgi:CBS domain-containing protein